MSSINIFDELFNNSSDDLSVFEKYQIIEKYINNINDKNHIGFSVLHVACVIIDEDSFNIVKLLLSKGADVNAKDSQGYTPLHNMLVNYEYLIETNSKVYIDLIHLLLRYNSDVNTVSKDVNNNNLLNSFKLFIIFIYVLNIVFLF